MISQKKCWLLLWFHKSEYYDFTKEVLVARTTDLAQGPALNLAPKLHMPITISVYLSPWGFERWTLPSVCLAHSSDPSLAALWVRTLVCRLNYAASFSILSSHEKELFLAQNVCCERKAHQASEYASVVFVEWLSFRFDLLFQALHVLCAASFIINHRSTAVTWTQLT